MKKTAFSKKLQDRHKLCILKITLFAYDYLFKQQRNSHNEYLVNKKTFSIKRVTSSGKNTSNQGADMIIIHHLGQSSQDSRNLSKYQIARGRSPSESLGALDMNSTTNLV